MREAGALDWRLQKGKGFDPEVGGGQLLLCFTSGGVSLADAGRLNQDTALKTLVGVEAFADETTLGEWLREVGPAALEYMELHKPKLPFVFLHWPEVAGSFWKSHPDPEPRWNLLEEDMAGRRKLHELEVDALRVARRAAGLMKGFPKRWQKLRALAAMHVAAAVESGADTFLSFDVRSFQRCLAVTQRLKVWPPLTAEESARLDRE